MTHGVFDNVADLLCFCACFHSIQLDHGSKGLSQERAFVTGLVAASRICENLGQGKKAEIYDVEEDEAHLAFGKSLAKQMKGFPPNPAALFNYY